MPRLSVLGIRACPGLNFSTCHIDIVFPALAPVTAVKRTQERWACDWDPVQKPSRHLGLTSGYEELQQGEWEGKWLPWRIFGNCLMFTAASRCILVARLPPLHPPLPLGDKDTFREGGGAGSLAWVTGGALSNQWFWCQGGRGGVFEHCPPHPPGLGHWPDLPSMSRPGTEGASYQGLHELELPVP